MIDSNAVSVSQLTAIVKGALAASPHLEDILVEGEISNLSTPVSGHIYFTLKDATSSVPCVVFRTQAQRVRFRLENGMTIFATMDIWGQCISMRGGLADLGEHTIDERTGTISGVNLGQFHRLVDRYRNGNIRVVENFGGGHAQK